MAGVVIQNQQDVTGVLVRFEKLSVVAQIVTKVADVEDQYVSSAIVVTIE